MIVVRLIAKAASFNSLSYGPPNFEPKVTGSNPVGRVSLLLANALGPGKCAVLEMLGHLGCGSDFNRRARRTITQIQAVEPVQSFQPSNFRPKGLSARPPHDPRGSLQTGL